MEKRPGGFTIVCMCTVNENYMMYGSWDMEHERHNFLSFWSIFCPFIPLKTQKIATLKKYRKCRNHHFTGVPKTHVYHMMYGFWDME